MAVTPAPTQVKLRSDGLARSIDRLIEDAREIREAAKILDDGATEAEQRYCNDVAVTLAMMEYDVTLAHAALKAHRADGAEDLHISVQAIADATRGWLDDMAIQTHLASMDVRDRSDAVGQRLERAAAEARRTVTRVGDAIGTDVAEARRIALEGIGAVRATFGDSAERCDARMSSSQLESLPLERCVQLLGSCSVGRIAMVVDRYPVVFPVNYRLVVDPDPWLVIRTRPGGAIDRSPSHVAFEIDGIDVQQRTGWSVLVRGGVRSLVDDDPAVLALIDPHPWLVDERNLWLAIQPLTISGRIVHGEVVEWAYHAAAYL